jgi:hypothetical protein
MTKKRFKSKIDRWLLFVLIAVMVFEVIVMSIAALQSGDPRVSFGLIATAFLIVALIGSLLIGTHYTVEGNTLRVASGPFRWKVPIDQIRSVQATPARAGAGRTSRCRSCRVARAGRASWLPVYCLC